MSKKKLIKQLKNKNPSLTLSQLETVIDVFFQSIKIALKNGNAVEIRNFGRWHTKKLKENYNARNPKTNEFIYKPERTKIKFKTSKMLNKIINK